MTNLKTYANKMQVLVPLNQAMQLIDIFGADFFSRVGIRKTGDISIILEQNIQQPHGGGDQWLKDKLLEMDKKHNPTDQYGFIKVEFIKK